MGKNLVEGLITVATAIVGLAIIAVLVSKNAQTGSVLTAAGSALGGSIQAATGPVTNGGSSGTNLLSNSLYNYSTPIDAFAH